MFCFFAFNRHSDARVSNLPPLDTYCHSKLDASVHAKVESMAFTRSNRVLNSRTHVPESIILILKILLNVCQHIFKHIQYDCHHIIANYNVFANVNIDLHLHRYSPVNARVAVLPCTRESSKYPSSSRWNMVHNVPLRRAPMSCTNSQALLMPSPCVFGEHERVFGEHERIT